MLIFFTKFYNFFFLIITFFYNLFPKKARPILLLLVSLVFFYLMSSKLIIFLFSTITSIYLSTILMGKLDEKKNELLDGKSSEEKKQIKKIYNRKKKIVLIACILLNFSFLFLFKYLKFFTINSNHLLNLLNINYQFSVLKIIAPIGISFYTLQALSYLFDVYYGKISADKNYLRVALFISFFPQIVEGPMARYSDTAEDLYKGNDITYANFTSGMQRILWGLFKKMIIADRLNILVKMVFSGYAVYSGPICFIGALGYTIMLYMNFSSTMDIVIGIGEILGVKIPENFRQPFFSKSISEFWTRWHISLGLWFRDYIYYPISLSKTMKKLTINSRKIVGNYFGPLISGTIALFAVWSLNGLWHGAGWTFIMFGMYHFVMIFTGNLFEPLIRKTFVKFNLDRENIYYRIFRSIKTSFLVIIGELIFRAPSVKVALVMLKKVFTDFNIKISEMSSLGLDILDYIILFVALVLVLIVGIIREKNISIRQEIGKMNIIVRWAIFYIMIFVILIFGAYGIGYQPVGPMYADF